MCAWEVDSFYGGAVPHHVHVSLGNTVSGTEYVLPKKSQRSVSRVMRGCRREGYLPVKEKKKHL